MGMIPFPSATEAKEMTMPSEEHTIQNIVQVSPSFQVTSYMLQMDEAIAQTLIKYLV
jgi:hypothetical protein